jgi:post-segregation antitoxin (ccd killing protein)
MTALTSHAEKVTVTLPSDLKQRLVVLKDELSLSMSALYKEALEAYLEAKTQEKWEEGIALALTDSTYLSFVKEISDDTGDVYGY